MSHEGGFARLSSFCILHSAFCILHSLCGGFDVALMSHEGGLGECRRQNEECRMLARGRLGTQRPKPLCLCTFALLLRSPQHTLHPELPRLLPLPFRRGEGWGEGLLRVVYPAVLAVYPAWLAGGEDL